MLRFFRTLRKKLIELLLCARGEIQLFSDMKNCFIAISLVAAFFTPSELHGQSGNIIFRNITPENGLPVTSVLDVTQDAFGYIWIGTWDGVFRYDGSTFEKKSDNGRYVEADQKGGVWISYDREGSVAFYSAETDSLQFYKVPGYEGRFPTIKADVAGNIWIEIARGLYRFNESTNSFEKDSPHETGLVYDVIAHADSSISFVYRNPEEVWGIGRRSADGTYDFEEAPTDLNRADRQSFITDDRITLLSFRETGMVLVNRTGWAYKEHQTAEWVFVKPEKPEILNERALNGIIHNNSLFVLHRNELTEFNIRTGDFTTYSHNPLNHKSLLQFDQLFTGVQLFIDRQEVLWIPSFANGFSRLNLYESDFGLLRSEDGTPIRDVISAVELENGSFWVGTRFEENGLLHFDSDGNIIERLSGPFDSPPGKSASNELSHPFVWSLTRGSDGSIWAGTGSPAPEHGGLNRIRSGSDQITRFKHDPENEASLYPGNWVRSIIEDGSGRIWVHSFGNIAWIDPETEIVTRFQLPENDGTSGGEALFILKTDTGDLIISTESNSYYRIHHADLSTELLGQNLGLDPRSTDTQRRVFLNRYWGTKIAAQDSKNRFWAVNHTGFGLLDSSLSAAEKWFDIDTFDFPFTRLSSIQIDNNNMIWLSTDNGIVKFNPVTENHTHYPYERGLQGHHYPYTDSYKGPSGKIYFYGNGGINIFDPDQIRVNPHPPEMVFTNLKLDGKQVQHGPGQPVMSPIQRAREIVIRPDISTISIEFAAMHFAGDRSNRYQYRLEGFDSDWRDGGSIGQATYTNLSPGNYRFRIWGSNLDGVWSDGSSSVSIVVLPPWWRTWWAYGFYLILFIAGIVAADRIQRRRLIKREQDKAREKELEQAKEIEKAYKNLEIAHENLKSAQHQLVQQEKLASLGQLTAGIAHEIKNPLNFVNNFSEVSIEMVNEAREEVKHETADGKRQKEEILNLLDDVEANLRKIHEHGSRADGIVKSMLQHSRGGSGKMEPTDLNALVREYVNLSFHGMRAGKEPINVDIDLQLDDSVGELPLVIEDFSRVILNLCQNAFDAMREQSARRIGHGAESYLPKLIVRTKHENGSIVIEVEDNGPGIPEEIKDKILQPFFTTKKGTQGTGLGLSITHDIVKAYGGTLDINSSMSGTVFKIILGKNHG